MEGAKQSFPVLDLLKQIHKTFSKRPDFIQELPELYIPSFRATEVPLLRQKFDVGVGQAADALMEVAFAVKAIVEPLPLVVTEEAGAKTELRVKQLEVTLAKLYAEKRGQDQAQAQLQDRFKKGLRFSVLCFFLPFLLLFLFFFFPLLRFS